MPRDEVDPRDWSPTWEGERKRGAALIKVIGNLGDEHPFDYGGFIVYRVADPTKTGSESRWTAVEYWGEPTEVDRDDPKKDTYQVFRWNIENDVLKDLDWVEGSDLGGWEAVAKSVGMSLEKLKKDARSGNALDRAWIYKLVGDFYGIDNLDSYPLELTREEMEKRWPEFR